ncbi:hypothetical protein GCM10027061_20570 [Nesterenkonia suensis]
MGAGPPKNAGVGERMTWRPDLPPRWDGYEVTWSGRWNPRASTIHAHLTDYGACESCGSLAIPLCQTGEYAGVGLRLAHSPLPRRHRRKLLLACRCADCQHTVVIDLYTLEVWDLDSSDYTDQGSYETAPPCSERRTRA